MPWYIADYLADTAHLRAAQSGAYLHLIMHYWQHGGVPDNNTQLAAIARMSDAEWKKARPIIEPFFQMPGWKHKRVEEEIIKADAKYELRAAAGRRGGIASGTVRANPNQTGSIASVLLQQTGSKTPSEIEAKTNQPQPQPQPQRDDDDAGRASKSLIKPETFELTKEVIQMMGLDPDDPKAVGAAYQVQSWINGHWPAEAIRAGVKQSMARRSSPPETLRYFEKAILKFIADSSRTLPTAPQETSRGRIPRTGSLIAVLDDDIARSIEEDRRASMHEGSVLSLPPRSIQ